MSLLRRVLAVATLIAALVPSVAVARAACCRPNPPKHACCAGGGPSRGMQARGCCKTPKVPAPATRAQDRAPRGVVAPAPVTAHAAVVSTPLPAAPAARLARLGSRAPAPDASPPDLLARHVVLLI